MKHYTSGTAIPFMKTPLLQYSNTRFSLNTVGGLYQSTDFSTTPPYTITMDVDKFFTATITAQKSSSYSN
jgi:hypothetical protein